MTEEGEVVNGPVAEPWRIFLFLAFLVSLPVSSAPKIGIFKSWAFLVIAGTHYKND